jgi:uncharacterized protein YjbI with pentapeptide repeats
MPSRGMEFLITGCTAKMGEVLAVVEAEKTSVDVRLAGAKLIKVEAYRANFTKCKILPEVYPHEMKYPDFSNSSFEEENLRGAHIVEAKFRGASLISVDFSRAIIHQCDFTNADISNSNWLNAKSVTNCIWVGIKYNDGTKLTEKQLREIRRQNESTRGSRGRGAAS